jgi:hypothetical protein
LISFAAFGSIKENPDRKVIAEVLKSMFGSGRGKQEVMGRKCLPRGATNKLATALRHDVNLIARMRHLEVRAAWLGQLNYEGTMFEQHDVVFALGTRQATKPVSETNLHTFVIAHGDDRNNTLQCEPQPNSTLSDKL